MRNCEYVPAVEVPLGKPQVRYFEKGNQWVPRGSVLRCELLTDAAWSADMHEPFVCIDDRDFTLAEFVKMVGTYGGWGVRIEFVPDDELHERPEIEVREPEEEQTNPHRTGERSPLPLSQNTIRKNTTKTAQITNASLRNPPGPTTGSGQWIGLPQWSQVSASAGWLQAG